MRSFCSLFFAFTISFFLTSSLFAANITIGVGVENRNPTLLFRGITGNTELSNRIQSDLTLCGWFDVVASGASDYIVSGAVNSNLLKVDFIDGAGNVLKTYTVSSTGNTDMIAHSVVDAILKDRFEIAGICKTKIVFASETSPGIKEIYVCDFDGRNLKALTTNNTLSIDPVWHPNGQSIIYSYFGRSYTHLIELQLATNKSRRLTHYKGINAGGVISPDGKYVAVVLALNNQVDLYIRETEGGALQRLTNDKAVEASPCWSPDGRKICYVSDKDGRPELFIVDLTNGTHTKLSAAIGSERVAPDWSTTNLIAYSSRMSGTYVLSILDVSKTPPVRKPIPEPTESNPSPPLIEIPGEGPSWAPDNRHVVLAHNGVIWIVDTKFGKKRRLLNINNKLSGPDWSPILY